MFKVVIYLINFCSKCNELYFVYETFISIELLCVLDGVNYTGDAVVVGEGALVPVNAGPVTGLVHVPAPATGNTVQSIIPRRAPSMPKPKWHAPWKLYRVISGHLGWVRCVAVEPGNDWFATGSADRVIKVIVL
jgi:pleiotropic regulator 1